MKAHGHLAVLWLMACASLQKHLRAGLALAVHREPVAYCDTLFSRERNYVKRSMAHDEHNLDNSCRYRDHCGDQLGPWQLTTTPPTRPLGVTNKRSLLATDSRLVAGFIV